MQHDAAGPMTAHHRFQHTTRRPTGKQGRDRAHPPPKTPWSMSVWPGTAGGKVTRHAAKRPRNGGIHGRAAQRRARPMRALQDGGEQARQRTATKPKHDADREARAAQIGGCELSAGGKPAPSPARSSKSRREPETTPSLPNSGALVEDAETRPERQALCARFANESDSRTT